jgi:hypothetical protein
MHCKGRQGQKRVRFENESQGWRVACHQRPQAAGEPGGDQPDKPDIEDDKQHVPTRNALRLELDKVRARGRYSRSKSRIAIEKL